MTWPLEGGQTGIVPVDRNLRGIVKRGGELASTLAVEIAKQLTLFPKLATPGSRTINFGSSSLTYAGGLEASNTKEIEHGLGTTPASVIVAVSGGASGFNSWIRTTAKGATKFTVQCHNPGKPGAGSEVAFDWAAIG